jgi:lysozyme
MDRDALRNMLARHEGLRLRPYPCSRNHMTIGYGWNLKNPLPRSIDAYLNINGEITKEMAEKLLDISMDAAIRQAWDIFPQFGGFSERRQAALVDVTFNMGSDKIVLEFPNFCKAVNDGDWNRAADELMYVDGLKKDKLSAYWKQTRDRAKKVTKMIRFG